MTQVIRNPAGGFSLVGWSIPAHPRTLRFRKPTSSDVMAGRIVERNGKTYGWTGRSFPTERAAYRALRMASR